MTDAMRDLGRRAAACRGWRWMEGMLAVRVEDGRKYRVNTVSLTSTAYVPDLTDFATRGCLLALVREAWEQPLLGVAFDFDTGEWVVRSWNGSLLRKGFGDTEEAALVAALEAAHDG